jgi:hypothetical protein
MDFAASDLNPQCASRPASLTMSPALALGSYGLWWMRPPPTLGAMSASGGRLRSVYQRFWHSGPVTANGSCVLFA